MAINLSDYETTIGEHQAKTVIWLRFDYDSAKIETIKSIGAKWSQSAKSWYLKDGAAARKLIGLPQASIGKEALSNIAPVNQAALARMEETLLLKAYSPSTVRTYCIEFAQLLYLLRDVDVASLTSERLRSYILYCVRELRLSENAVHSRLNAIKFYFEQVLHREKFFADIPRPKKPSLLPKTLSAEDIKKIIAAAGNMKHRLMLQLCYGMGLRVSEVTGIKIHHIDSARMQVLIAGAKGKKDRYVNLPESILESLREYYKSFRPKDYLFEGQHRAQYSIRSVQAVFKSAMAKAGVNKPIGIHGLRHSYATHLHEYGTDIALIKELLGHNDIKTTLIYTHVSRRAISKVGSPLDKL